MPLISVIIVNYNVKYFLEKCIQSLLRSDINEQLEIIVVDNNSQDGSKDFFTRHYPHVKYIYNEENLGFSKANNIGIQHALGEYLLILNPDTIVDETTISHCLKFAREQESLGAIGVKMIDGAGNYLPESKRGFPKPLSALYKMTGLSKLFPKSKIFNAYYAGHLDKDSVHEVEVLSGAFMFIPKNVMNKIGGFDQDYFMYGEDIELSYQIKNQGFKIFYLPLAKIIHFKGESTDKSSLNYIRNFYGAMRKYAKKRNSGSGNAWGFLIQIGILFSSITALIKAFIKLIGRQILDALLLFTGTRYFQKWWGQYRFDDVNYYDQLNNSILVTIMVVILILMYTIFGQYDRKHNLKHLIYGFVFGALSVFFVYSLLPLDWRYSRIVLLFLVLLSPCLLYFTRKVYNKILYKTGSFSNAPNHRIAIVGEDASFDGISKILNTYGNKSKVVGIINESDSDRSLGKIDNINTIVKSRQISEIVFASKDLTTQTIFQLMSNLGSLISFKIANDDNTSILGSHSKKTTGSWYTLDINFKIDQVFHRRIKRLLDLDLCVMSILLAPILFVFSPQRLKIYKNLIPVLLGQKTWIGYLNNDDLKTDLPKLKSGVFEIESYRLETYDKEIIHSLNLDYVRKYSIWLDMEHFFKNIVYKK